MLRRSACSPRSPSDTTSQTSFAGAEPNSPASTAPRPRTSAKTIPPISHRITAGIHPKGNHLRDCRNDRNRDDFRTLQLREDQRNPAEIRGQHRQIAHFRGERRGIIALDGEITTLRYGERVVLQLHRGFRLRFSRRWKRGNREFGTQFELLGAGGDEIRQLPRVLHELRIIAGIPGVFQVGADLVDDVRRNSTWKRGTVETFSSRSARKRTVWRRGAL